MIHLHILISALQRYLVSGQFIGHRLEISSLSLDSSGDLSHHDITPLMCSSAGEWPFLGGDFSEVLLRYELLQQSPT